MYRHWLKHDFVSVITKDYTVKLLENENEIFRLLQTEPVYRSFPNGVELTPDAANILIKILEDGAIQFNIEDTGTMTC